MAAVSFSVESMPVSTVDLILAVTRLRQRESIIASHFTHPLPLTPRFADR